MADEAKKKYGMGHMLMASGIGFGAGFGVAVAIGIGGDYLRTPEEREAAQKAMQATTATKS